jgi:hypothetical protein
MPADTPTPEHRPTASERLAAALGRPAPAPLTGERLRRFEEAEDRADAEARRIYGLSEQVA